MNILIPLVLIAIIFFVIGFISGSLFSTSRAGRKDSQYQQPARASDISYRAEEAVIQPELVAAKNEPLSQSSAPAAPRSAAGLPVTLDHRQVLNAAQRSKTTQTESPAQKGQPKSMVAQIDDILQDKLIQGAAAHLPPEKRAIRLMETPGQGVSVVIGLDQYDGLDAVPDEEVRAIIREAVNDWENQKSFE